MLVRWQSFVDAEVNAPYLDRLQQYLTSIAGPSVRVEVAGMTPPARSFGRLSELRCAVAAVDQALQAEADGVDAFVFGHFQEPGLYEARSACRIPIGGIGESSLLWASHIGRRIGLVSIDPVFEVIHLEQAQRYGLESRIAGVRALGATVADFAEAFAGNRDAYEELVAAFTKEARILVDQGADVIVPAGGLFALLVAHEQAMTVGSAPVVNCIAIALAWIEISVRMKQANGLHSSRGPSFALVPDEAIADFRAMARPGQTTTNFGPGVP